MFRLLNGGLFFDKESGAGSGEKPVDGPEAVADQAKAEAGNDANKDAPKTEEKQFSQADVDRIVKERLDRERKKSEKTTAKAKKDAEDAALAKNQEWEQLATKRQQEIETLQKTNAELEAYKQQADRYKLALDTQLADIKKGLPKFVLPLIEKMDPVEAMKYIAENREELGVKPETYSPTPKPQVKKVRDEDTKSGLQASGTLVSRSF